MKKTTMTAAIFCILLLFLVAAFALPAFATAEEKPYRQEVRDFLCSLLSDDVYDMLHDPNRYSGDMQTSYVEDAAPIRVLPRGYFGNHSIWGQGNESTTFREKLNEEYHIPTWYWLLDEEPRQVIISDEDGSGELAVNLMTVKIKKKYDIKDEHNFLSAYMLRLTEMISLWEREGLPQGLTDVYIVDLDCGDILICCEYGDHIEISGVYFNPEKGWIQCVLSEPEYDRYLMLGLLHRQALASYYHAIATDCWVFDAISVLRISQESETYISECSSYIGTIMKRYIEEQKEIREKEKETEQKAEALAEERLAAMWEEREQLLMAQYRRTTFFVGITACATTAVVICITAILLRKKRGAAACDNGAAPTEEKNA